MFRVHKWETFPKLGDELELLPCLRPLILGMPPNPGGEGGCITLHKIRATTRKYIYNIKIVEHKGPNTHVIIHAKAPMGRHGTKK